ncbi:phage holin family protein [Micromonospora sp. H33]|uniref:phage holin family protein n=1 Tax=Micromonospora sp. H33 TaxID=3452215 RepID=UPI003F88E62A
MTRSTTRTAERSETSVGELLTEVTRDVSTLVRQEVELAKAELREEARTAGKVAGMFAAAGLAGLLTLLFLSYALWWGLSNVMDEGWAALIVAVIWAVIGMVLLARARGNMRQLRPLPRTKQTAREIPQTMRGR